MARRGYLGRTAVLCGLVAPFAPSFANAALQQHESQGTEAPRERALALGRAFVARTRGTTRSTGSPVDVELELPRCAERGMQIQDELAKLGEHDWAGTYYQGDHLGVNVTLTIAPQSGATYTWSGCMGTYDLNYGSIAAVTPDGIELVLSFDPRSNRGWYHAGVPMPYMSSRWVPVRWGAERFLIPDCQLIRFCNDVNGEHRFMSYPIRMPSSREGMGWQRPDGLPVVPSAYEPFLLHEPLVTSIVACSERKDRGQRGRTDAREYLLTATVDLGLESGLLPGMVLHAVEPEHLGEGMVLDVEPDRATVEFRPVVAVEERDLPRPGWKLSTRERSKR